MGVAGGGIIFRLLAILGCLSAATLSGCAVVEDIGPDGRTQRSLAFAATMDPRATPPASGHVLKVTGMGIAATNQGWTLGLFQSSEVTIDEKCHVVLVGNSDEQLKHFAALVNGVHGVCAD